MGSGQDPHGTIYSWVPNKPEQLFLELSQISCLSAFPEFLSTLCYRSHLTCLGGPGYFCAFQALKVEDPWLLPLLQSGNQLRLEDQEPCCGVV